MEPHAREGASATQASAASADVARGSGDALPTGTATRGAKRSGGESLVDPRLEPASPRAPSKQNTTGSPERIAQSRAASWEPADQSSGKKWRPTGELAGLIEETIALIEHEVIDTEVQQYVRAAEDFAKPEVSAEDRLKLRRQEIQKLEDFKTFKAMPVEKVPQGQRVYEYTWVDTQPKSRITCKDLRRFASDDTMADRSSPTPSQASVALFEYFTIATEATMLVFDAMSAFLHAPEKSEMIFMRAPDEWADMQGLAHGATVWQLLKSLYGRRTAGANFRDLLEAVVIAVPGMDFQRGNAEPCIYFSKEASAAVIHHVDDGIVSGTAQATSAVVAWCSKYILLKLSPPIQSGMSYKLLGRIKVRTDTGFNTYPDKKLLENIMTALGYDTKEKVKPCPTPGVKRLKEINGEVDEAAGRTPKAFRSGVGSGLYLAADIEILAFPIKELSRRMQTPDAEAWAGLARVGRFMVEKTDYGVMNSCEGVRPSKHVMVAKVDAATMSDENGRATSGFRVLINGYKISHYSGTQPGLPALSSGEAELRAKTRAACELLYLQSVAGELGIETQLWMETDATASMQNASKLSGGRMKHIGHMDSFIKQVVKNKLVRLRHTPGVDNSADLLTKHVAVDVLNKLGPETGFQKLPAPPIPAKLTAVNTVEDLEAPEQLVKEHDTKCKAEVAEQGKALAPSKGISATSGMMLIAAVVSSADAHSDTEVNKGWHWSFLWLALFVGIAIGRFVAKVEARLNKAETVQVCHVSSQSPCTYTWWTTRPRFSVLGLGEHG